MISVKGTVSQITEDVFNRTQSLAGFLSTEHPRGETVLHASPPLSRGRRVCIGGVSARGAANVPCLADQNMPFGVAQEAHLVDRYLGLSAYEERGKGNGAVEPCCLILGFPGALSEPQDQRPGCCQGTPTEKYMGDGTSLCARDMSASVSTVGLPAPEDSPSVIYPWIPTERAGERWGAEMR